MSDTERITQPSQGSNALGAETDEETLHGAVSSGTDTQLHIAAKSGKKHKKNINDDEKIIKNHDGENKFLKSDDTDE